MDLFKVINNEGGFWIPMAVGAGLGLLKNQDDQSVMRAQNKAAAAQTEFSPLTGMGPGQIQRSPSPFEGLMQGAMAGAQFGAAGKAAGLWGKSQDAIPAATMAGTQGSQVTKPNPWGNMNQGMYA